MTLLEGDLMLLGYIAGCGLVFGGVQWAWRNRR